MARAAVTRTAAHDRPAAAAPAAGAPALPPEAFRPIARHLLAHAFAADARPADRVILITSPGAADGKTFTALNLALGTVRDGGRPVLLIDGDSRSAGLARRFGRAPDPGLAEILSGSGSPHELIAGVGEGLSLLAPGTPARPMVELLASRRMVRLVRELLAKEPERLLVIDAPSLLSSVEAAALALFAGQVVLVTAAGRTSEDAVRSALTRLGDRRNLWVVLNHPGPG